MPFSSLGCMHTKYLATKCIIIQHCWIIEIWSDHGQGKALLTRHLNKCLVSDYSANTAYIYWGGLWRQTCCSGMGGKLQLKHAPAAKKSVILNKTKKCTKMYRNSRSAKTGKHNYRDDSIKQFSIEPHLHIFNMERYRYVGWGCILNSSLLLSVYLVSLLFTSRYCSLV